MMINRFDSGGRTRELRRCSVIGLMIMSGLLSACWDDEKAVNKDVQDLVAEEVEKQESKRKKLWQDFGEGEPAPVADPFSSTKKRQQNND